MIMPTLLHPKSVGELSLQSSDPFVHPLIDPHYLEHEEDAQLMAHGLRIARKIGSAKAFAGLVSGERVDVTAPGGDQPDSDQYLHTHLHKGTLTVYHQARTSHHSHKCS